MPLERAHRYYLLKQRADIEGLANVWRAKHEALPGRPLPYTYPLDARLDAAGYRLFEDILGATAEELVAAGFSRREAAAVLLALTEGHMGYTMQNGRWADTEPVTPLPAGTRAETVTGEWIELGDRQTLRLTLDVSAASEEGDETLDVAIETSPDKTTVVAVGSFTQADAVSSERKVFAGLDRFVRAKGSIAGSDPSFTFSVAGEAA